ncbi:gas vesicle accessory protein GvpU [Metabacillus litoralis]|jgi:hypothetical protein|uniref:gas vesicle accessory protein GvpU n=1 Tax=Metabacillus litoralis TaxID=152268 RepID=UPI00203DC361|nr:gas vesicle accessory protein GvpU [Metabacillus litoralis]MCM3651023.1 hypothetical protein [Metabacillus litoralis]
MAKKKSEQIGTDDAVILMFLNLVEENGIEIPITLSVSGAVISGTLINASTYYAEITESSKLPNTTISKIMYKNFSDLKEAYAKQKQEEADKEAKKNSLTFIHLKDVKYLSTGVQPTPSSSNWWRGRISSIDGFSFDSLV